MQAEQMRIELLAEDQWQRYRAVRLRALTDTPDAFARTYVEEEAFPEQDWRRRLSSGAKTFVAVLDDSDVVVQKGQRIVVEPFLATELKKARSDDELLRIMPKIERWASLEY